MTQKLVRAIVTVAAALAGAVICFVVLDMGVVLITGDIHSEVAIGSAAVVAIVGGAMFGQYIGNRIAARQQDPARKH